MSGHSLIGNSLRDALLRCDGIVAEMVAPAKVNLRLKVLGRRPDGYHLLSMLNCSTSLSDTVRISFHRDEACSVEMSPQAGMPANLGENLVSKAWRYFWREFGISEPGFGFRCEIEKRIPIGGGLGGGSSDAGAMLRALRNRFGVVLAREFGLSDAELSHRLNAAALACGADVPYAVVGGAAVVTGIGEHVASVSGGPIWGGSVVLMVPPVPVPTLTFYDFFRRTRPSLSACEDRELSRFVTTREGDLVSLVENDFEGAVCEMVPALGEALQRAREVVPKGTALTGSGSVFFSLLRTGQDALYHRLVERTEGLGVRCHLCHIVSE
jgi:4-diphosphocytidyl-2-C-methyl-D-erythritol kinase